MPLSPALPSQPLRTFTPYYVKTFKIDPENLRPGITQGLTVVEEVWRLRTDDTAQTPDPSLLSPHAHPGSIGGFDVLRVLKVTTHAIRSQITAPADLPARVALHKRAAEAAARLLGNGPHGVTNPLARICRAALDVLTVLRELEKSARVPLSYDTYDASSDRSLQSRTVSPAELSDVPTDASFSVSVMRVGGRRESILVWDEEEDDFNVDEESERAGTMGRTARTWQWLALQASIKIEDLGKQQGAIVQYLDTIDEVGVGVRAGAPARREKGRRSSAPLPDLDLRSDSLRKPWGYINDDWIDDIVALEDALSASADDGSQAEKDRKGWTFKRTDNLRLWGAALRLRYMLPIISPATPDVPTSKPSPMGAATAELAPPLSPSTRTMTAKSSEMPVFFDARVVMRQDDGWEDMLERKLLRWTSVVVDERRNRSR
ncbi:hypothetical protein F5888DRAFT_1840286 [Russula emetica]|nr:hypothetical protein F5888DRAFT_1840286 [Russula emetica]